MLRRTMHFIDTLVSVAGSVSTYKAVKDDPEAEAYMMDAHLDEELEAYLS